MKGYNDHLSTTTCFLISHLFEWHSKQKLQGIRLPLSHLCAILKVSVAES